MRNFYFLRTLLLASIILISLSVHSQVTLMADDDGTAYKEMPDSTAAGIENGGNISVYKTDTTEAIAFIKFDITKFQGKIVSGAAFSTRAAMKEEGKTMTVALVEAKSTDFTRDSLTWNNKPGTGGELATVVIEKSSARKDYIPNGTKLTDFINNALAQGKDHIAFALKYKSGDGGYFSWAGGAGDGSYGPMLELTFDEGFNYWAVADGTAFKENPDTTATWKGATNIFIWKTDTTEAIAYVKFELPGFAYKSVNSAEFSTRAAMKSGKTMTVALTGANSADFTRDQLTWNNKPGTTGELATVLLEDNSARKTYTETGNKLVEFINGELAKGNEEIAFALKYQDGDGADTDFSWAGGAGDGAYGPMLKVTEGMAGGGYATDDGFVLQAHPDSMASPNASNIYASKSSDTTERIAYVKFDISAFAGKTVEEVKFSLRGAMKSGSTMTLGLHKVNTTNFIGDSVTWNTRPGTGSEVATLVLTDNSSRKYFVSSGNALADYLNQMLMSGAEEIAFALKYKEGDGDELSWIGGKDDGSYGPMLELEFGYGFNSYAIDDGTGFKENPDTTAFWKSQGNIFIYKTDSTEAVSYVKFDVSALSGETITEAVFSTRAAMKEEGKTMTVSLTGANTTDFTRSGLTWNNRPGTGDELATVVIEKSSSRKEYTPTGTNLVDYVNEKLAALETEIAFAIKYKSGDGGDFSWAGGAGDGAYGPQLELEIEKPVSIDTITVIEDAYVLEAYPDSTGEGVADMQIGRDDSSNADKESFLKFPVEEKASPAGKVTLLLKGDIKDSNPDDLEKFTIQIIGVSNAWSEDTIDWKNKPAEESEVLATYDIT
ncbi:MAG: DNRLRE domain-containing protein, partial [Tangfeifania sp.]